MLSQCLLNKFLHRSSIGSLLRACCWLGTKFYCCTYFVLSTVFVPVVGVAIDLEEAEGDVLDLYAGLLQAGGRLVVAENVLVGGQVLGAGDQRDAVQEVGGRGQLLF